MFIRYDGEGGTGGTGGAGGGGEGGAGGTAPNSLLTGATGAGGTGTGNDPNAGKTGAGDFKLPDGWDYRTALPAELKESPSAKKYGSLADLVRGFDNAQQLIGKPTERLVEIPPDASPEVRRGVLERLGLPKNLTDYKVNPVKGAEQVIPVDSPAMKSLTETAHKLGVLPEQFQGLVEAFGGMTVEGQKRMATEETQRNADNITKLKEQYGEAFDGKVAAANFAIEKLGKDKAGSERLREVINSRGLGTDPALLDAFATVGEMLNESSEGGDKTGGIGQGMTPDAAKAEGTRLLQEALNEKNPVRRKELNEKAQEFFAKATKRPK